MTNYVQIDLETYDAIREDARNCEAYEERWIKAEESNAELLNDIAKLEAKIDRLKAEIENWKADCSNLENELEHQKNTFYDNVFTINGELFKAVEKTKF